MNAKASLRIIIATVCLMALFPGRTPGQNPIVPGAGIADPHARVFGDRVYIYATHDFAFQGKGFDTRDWWIWSSGDLVNWEKAGILKPEETYFRKPSTMCWAGDAMEKDGKYYWYFSMGPTNIGVVTGNSPTGPWNDPIGSPLIPKELTVTEERDPSLFTGKNGDTYIVFGVWDFYIARLNRDMISLAETPKLLELDIKDGPYGPGKTDDKACLHQYKNKYYLSWGCYYAMADNIYGPYQYKGSIIVKERTDSLFQHALTFDRHGSFFELYNQCYFICNDQGYPGSNGHFRNSVISYIHYRDNGEIEPVYLTKTGVGRYDAAVSKIEAEDYFKAKGTTKKQLPGEGFEMVGIRNGSLLEYPNMENLKKNATVQVRYKKNQQSKGTILFYDKKSNNQKQFLGKCQMPPAGVTGHYDTIQCKINNQSEKVNLILEFRGAGNELFCLDWLKFN